MSLAGRPSAQAKLERLLAVATEHMERGRIYYQRVYHDDGCPTIETQSLLDCTCDPAFSPPEDVTPTKGER